MEGSPIEDALDAALREFRKRPKQPESGLDVDDPALLQLRKSCRLLSVIAALQRQNGYYTLVIEASFGAIERTIQFYLLANGYLDEDDFVDHGRVYELGTVAGLYDDAFREKLERLWRNNRSRTYYREGIGTEAGAERMAALAEAIHVHVLQLAGASHECYCGAD
jgi:hypothetical protein